MRALINDYVRVAATKRTAPMIAEATPPASRSAVQRIAAAVITPAHADPAPTATIPLPRPAPVAAAAPGSSDPLEPITVKTFSVKRGAIQAVSLAAPTATASVTPAAPAKGPELAFADPAPAAPQPGVLGVLPVKMASALQPLPASETAESLLRAAQRPGWMIQVGAFDREDEAKSRLNTAQTRAKSLLGAADGFTERVTKGDKTLYRARFAGLDKDQAEAACQYLKKNDIACMALKN
jgi:D-alanyl-D-alanine carboxypeptidase